MGQRGDPDGLQRGWQALAGGDWPAAAASFQETLTGGSEAAGDLDGLGRARWWLGDGPGAVEAWERAYAAYRREGDPAAAGRMAGDEVTRAE